MQIEQAFSELSAARWSVQRSGPTTLVQARKVIEDLHILKLDPQALTPHCARKLVTRWELQGLKPATIKRRMAHLRTMVKHMGVNMPTVSIRTPREPKWWLRPSDQRMAVAWCLNHGHTHMALFIEFICYTGLRVEEAIRATQSDVSHEGGDGYVLRVHGTKTRASARTIPLSRDAFAVVNAARTIIPNRSTLIVPPAQDERSSYLVLLSQWNEVREAMGWPKDATLKGLRRTFAKYANDRGMPTAVLMRYLGHTKIETTLGYLDVVGANSPEIARQWL